MRILLVEDEDHIAKGLLFNFKAHGYETDHAVAGEAGLERFAKNRYDLLVLDVILPGIDGFEVARRVRRADGRIPILMLTAMSADEDRIAGLECGVDDYLTKPFVLKELMLRIAALLRRAQGHRGPTETFRFGQATIDPDTLLATGPAGLEARLTRIEVDLLRYFAANPGRLVGREELLTQVWGYQPDTATRTVDMFVARVRKIVEPKPAKPVYLRSVHGQGYRHTPSGSDEVERHEGA